MNDQNNDDMDWLYRRDQPSQPSPHPHSGYPDPRSYDYQQPQPSAPQQPVQQPRPTQPPRQTPPAQQPTRKPKKRHPIRNTIGLLLAAWLIYLVAVPIYAWTLSNVIDTNYSGDRPADQPGTTILLVGSDSREDLTAEEQAELGTGSTDGQRTDTMILLYNPPSGESALISLPRDSLVDIPGHGQNKLNAAYAFGGAPLLIQTIEQNTGVRVDGYLEVGFKGIVNVVDAVGGIEVCLDEPIQDQDSHLDLPAGCQDLDGVTTLGYVRMRKADPRGDLGRVERQREVIGKIADKVVSPITFINPIRYWGVATGAASSLSRGSDTGLMQMVPTVTAMAATAAGSGLSLTVPVSNTSANTSVGSAVIWDESGSQTMFGAIINNTPETLEQFQE